MSAIGGPGGIGGPRGPGGPEGPSALDVAEPAAEPMIEGPVASEVSRETEALAADVEAGRLTAREALDQLVESAARAGDLDATARAELRALLDDAVSNDPHLRSLAGRI
jgi:hypothetical protein